MDDCVFRQILGKFYGKVWVGFFLNTGKPLFAGISFKAKKRGNHGKNGTKDIQSSSPLKRSAYFYNSHWEFSMFSFFLTLTQVLSKTKTFKKWSSVF